MQKEQNLVRVCVLLTGLSLKETPHVWLPHTRLTFYCNGEDFWTPVSESIELMFKWNLHCLWGYFRKQTGREGV